MCKPDKGRRILKGMLLAVKWLWVALLTVTLAAGIIFRVHWKADALVIILIATAVIIPRSFRKYVCLGFAVVLAALAVWVFLPESGEGWMPYLYEDEIAALKAGLCAPDEANAATIYDRLSAGYDFEAAYLVLDCLPDSPSDEPYSFLRFQAMSPRRPRQHVRHPPAPQLYRPPRPLAEQSVSGFTRIHACLVLALACEKKRRGFRKT